MKIGFENGVPKKMMLKDNFGQQTHLQFDDFQSNVKLKASDFTFKVPQGVDVLKDESRF